MACAEVYEGLWEKSSFISQMASPWGCSNLYCSWTM